MRTVLYPATDASFITLEDPLQWKSLPTGGAKFSLSRGHLDWTLSANPSKTDTLSVNQDSGNNPFVQGTKRLETSNEHYRASLISEIGSPAWTLVATPQPEYRDLPCEGSKFSSYRFIHAEGLGDHFSAEVIEPESASRGHHQTQPLDDLSLSESQSEAHSERMWPYDGRNVHQHHPRDVRRQGIPSSGRASRKGLLKLGAIKKLVNILIRPPKNVPRIPDSEVPHPRWKLPYRSDRDSIASNESDGDLRLYLDYVLSGGQTTCASPSTTSSSTPSIVSFCTLDHLSLYEEDLFGTMHPIGGIEATLDCPPPSDSRASFNGEHDGCGGCSRWFESSEESMTSVIECDFAVLRESMANVSTIPTSDK